MLIGNADFLFAQNLFFPTQRTRIVYDAFLKGEGRSSDEPIQYRHFTYTSEYIPLYNTKNLKIFKCLNFILYGVSEDELVNHTTDTSYLVIVDESKYFNIPVCNPSFELCDMDAIVAIDQFLKNDTTISVSILRKKLKNPFLDTQKDKSSYYDSTFNSTLSTKRTHSNNYLLTFKGHNEHALYNISSNKGFTSCDYHWGRIVTYEVLLKIKKIVTL